MLFDVLPLVGFNLFISLIRSSWFKFENLNIFPFTLSFIFKMLGWDWNLYKSLSTEFNMWLAEFTMFSCIFKEFTDSDK